MGSSSSATEVKYMSPQQLGAILGSGERDHYQIVDVREASELREVSLPDQKVINLPLRSSAVWETKIKEGMILEKAKPTICICHHGVRSLRVARFLTEQAGFLDVYSVQGGIDAYALDVDPSIGTY
eukprot:gene33898-41015_t